MECQYFWVRLSKQNSAIERGHLCFDDVFHFQVFKMDDGVYSRLISITSKKGPKSLGRETKHSL